MFSSLYSLSASNQTAYSSVVLMYGYVTLMLSRLGGGESAVSRRSVVASRSLRLARHNEWPVLLRGFQRDAGGSCAGLNVVAP